MKIGMIGLGRMGSGLVRRLAAGGYECVIYDVNPDNIRQLEGLNIKAASSTVELVNLLPSPRVVWLMIPAARVDDELAELLPHLAAEDIVIDGGNSHYRDDIRRNKALGEKGIHYLDVGTSGGVAGIERGYCLMIGGEESVVNTLYPVFIALAPGIDAAKPSPNWKNPSSTADQGFLYCGPAGAGHFVKMVHNGIEYGLMAAYAEGLSILQKANAGKLPRVLDAETTPLQSPEFFAYDFNLPEIAEVWRRGSVISSWLLDLTANALAADPDLIGFTGRVSDSGEGRWALEAAIEEGVPAPVISAALFERLNSQGNAEFAHKVLSAMRNQFGGHVEKMPGDN